MGPEPPKARLLVVDDDPDVLQTHVRVLSEYSPLRAEDGLVARQILSQTSVDVVLCDLSMPRLNGLDLMRWAKEGCPRPLWLVVSAQDTFDAAAQALKLGAFDFLCKPIMPIQLRTAVAHAMRHQDLLDERANLVRGLAENNRRLVQSLRELEGAYRVLREQQSMLDEDLTRAARVMRALLPKTLPSTNKIQLSVGYRPSDVIGGDLYGASMLDERHLAVYVADAAGHGVSAALLALLFKQRLRSFEEAGPPFSPAAALRELNRGLFDECRASGLFVTVILAILDTDAETLAFASAGHPPAFVIRRAGATERLEKTGPALGLTLDADFAERFMSLAAGDRLFFYTDGLTGAFATAASSEEAIVGAVQSGDGGGAIDRLFGLADRSGNCEDDVTLLLVTALGGESTVDCERQTTTSPPASDGSLRVATAWDTTWIILQGRVTWKYAPALREACVRALDAGRGAVLDLDGCLSLDSTLLGTIHELATRVSDGKTVRIQRVGEELRRLFAELAMTRVLSCIENQAEPPPRETESVAIRGDASAHALILRAHELLAELSPKNAEEFAPVIDALRQESSAR